MDAAENNEPPLIEIDLAETHENDD